MVWVCGGGGEGGKLDWAERKSDECELCDDECGDECEWCGVSESRWVGGVGGRHFLVVILSIQTMFGGPPT